LADWSLLTNHGRLLLAIEKEPGLRVRELHLSRARCRSHPGRLPHLPPRGPTRAYSVWIQRNPPLRT